MDRNLNFLISFLLFGLRRYLRCSVPLSPDVCENIATIVNLPFYDRKRDSRLVVSQIRNSPEFILEIGIQMVLLIIASYFFIRGLEQRAVERRPLPQPQTLHSTADAVPAPSPENVTQPTHSQNHAGFFSGNASNSRRLSRSEASESDTESENFDAQPATLR